MMIGLPNNDKTFTCTLFAPFRSKTTNSGEVVPGLLDLKSDDEIKNYFERYFPDAISVMPDFIDDYKRNPACQLVMTSCAPWNYQDKIVLMGDSAHAIVPFYGQGMNAGLEDVLVFKETLEKYGGDFSAAVPEFARVRKPTGDAIRDLSLHNYIEMRSHTGSTAFLLRKKVEGMLNWLFPSTWIPLYKMVAFTRIPYHECIEREKRQDRFLSAAKWALGISGIALGAAAMWTSTRRSNAR